ncbi:hypothetical protein [Methanolobus vulcani]|uniref:Uncharacterized protein n=1 Tax=Methanolobus vulcani TaxID=38026 RepID=A0A7Z8P319_9EURY|nr:hypothetical protein [Methanolobus vulcani]TQD28244.1 hypothetical protein FKV42_00810 [Methanolobus vulcani]
MRRFDDSAQLLLIAGFAVGVGIVVITIMLNNVIYASNIASESSIDTSRYDMANAVQMTTEACEDAYQYSITNGSHSSIDNDAFEQYMENYTDKVSQNFGIAGLTFSCQNYNTSTAHFTHSGLADGEDDWTVVENINTTDSFALSINDTSLLGNESNKVMIKATSTSGTMLWSMEFYNSSSGKINITVSNQSSTIENFQGDREINITDNRIDNGASGSSDFHFSDLTLGQEYSISIINGSQAVGTYSISGNLSTGQTFIQARYWVVNPTITLSSREMTINRTVPITLPGGVL